jgi:ribosome modulation factor
MKLEQIYLQEDLMQEWGLRSKEWKQGYKDGRAGQQRNPEMDSNKQYLNGWRRGYYEYICEIRPDLCDGPNAPNPPGTWF